MDANETRYHLLLSRHDWANCLSEDGQTLNEDWAASNKSGLAWNTANGELILRPRLVEFKTSKYDDMPTLDRRRGSGCDRYGNWYWIAESGIEIRVQSAGTGRSAHFWSADDGIGDEAQRPYGDFQPAVAPQPITLLQLSG